jgi:hypothetical protein
MTVVDSKVPQITFDLDSFFPKTSPAMKQMKGSPAATDINRQG